MLRSLATVTAAALVTIMAGCNSPAFRSEGTVILSTHPDTGGSSDVAIGGGDSPDGAPAATPVEQISVAAAPSAIDLVSRNGGLEVVVDPSAVGLTIQADLRCGGRTKGEADERLAGAVVEVTEDVDGTVRIRPTMPGGWKNGDAASFEITIPSPASVSAKSSNGSIKLVGCQGPMDLDTSNGRITLIGTSGDAVAETSNGRIVLEDTVGSIRARSSNGRVRITNHLGELAIRTSNGSMNINLHDDSDDPVVARTSNGSVEFSVGSGFGGWLRADTSNGGVSLDGSPNIDGSIEIKRRSMKVKLAGDTDESSISSSNGSVRVMVRQ